MAAEHSCFRKRLGLNCEAEENPYLEQLILMYSLLLEAMGKRVTNQWLPYPIMWEINDSPPKNQHLVGESFWVVQSLAICWEAWKCKTQVCVCMSFAWTFPLESIRWIAICWEAWKCKTQVCVCMSFAWTFPLESIRWIVTLSTLTYSMDIGDRWCLMLVTYHDKYPPRTNILFASCIFIHQHFVLLIGGMENKSEIYWKSWTMFSYICMFWNPFWAIIVFKFKMLKYSCSYGPRIGEFPK